MTRDKRAARSAVRNRIDAFLRTGDDELLLSRDATSEGTRLVIVGLENRFGRPDPAAFLTLGLLRWHTHLALLRRGRGECAESVYENALSLLAVAHRHRMRDIPGPVAELFRRTAAVRRDPQGALFLASRRLMVVASASISDREQDDLPDDHRSPPDTTGLTVDDLIDTLYHVLAVTTAYTDTHYTAGTILNTALLLRGHRADLDRAIGRLRRTVSDPNTPPDNRVGARRILGEALYLRGTWTDDPDELDEAITLLREPIDSVPGDHPSLPARWALLADAHYARHLAAPDAGTLGEAITAVRTAIRVGQALGHHPRVGHLTQLSSMLNQRHQSLSDADSLHESVAHAREAMALAEGDPLLLSDARPALAHALLARHQYDGWLGDVLDAVELLREQAAAAGAPPPSREKDPRQDLAVALVMAYRADLDLHKEHPGGAAAVDPSWLREAIGLLRQVLADQDTCDRDTGDRTGTLSNLGAALATWHERPDTPDVLDEVVDTYRRAVAEPDLPTTRIASLRNLAHALAQRSCERGDAAALREAIDVLRTATSTPGATSMQRIAGSAQWAEWAASTGDWPTAVDGYRAAIGRLPELVPGHLRRADQERLLAGRFWLASDAAAAALEAGRPDTALEMLEHGRSVLLSAALDADRELTELHSAAPTWAAELTAVRQALSEPDPDPDSRHALGLRMERTLREIRRRPGFEDFLAAPRADRLRARAARLGPVVTVNVSRYRCDALLLKGGSLRVVPLPDLEPGELDRRAAEFALAVTAAENPHAGLVQRLEAQATVRETLSWLWDAVAEPVLQDFGYTGLPPDGGPWPRVWWSPTGALNALPLHAAGRWADEETRPGDTVLDRVVSSYAPTIRALPTDLDHRVSRADGPPLVVAVPDTPGHMPLPATLAEATALGSASGARLLLGPRATRAAVAEALPSSRWAHFACHAHHDPVNPSGSHLVLHDQPLMVTDLHRLRASRAGLAYLSACSTARSAGKFTGESLHLGSAFRLVGFRDVIATLWQVHDQTAADLARAFYAGYGTSGAALALHQAVRAVRDADPLLPTRWAAHIHTGP
ncbi:CHAT domain-containing protein [Streptomyces laculatispora]|uniref:CHAT domain-containing protein n=1 Tax=Streptomyces laculatispora TaxID=887464 RepID=UPI001A944716|nr:CHAT domain-containing protein [Streptomyces laculatispora]MBO0915481.1 CHAT domain-containing protein [Streptomyces laculatispora]